MALALYAPGLGYYAGQRPKFGLLPPSPQSPQGSDFVTAPELSPLFGATLAVQVADALAASGTAEVWEFGAGSGALARQLLAGLAGQPGAPRRYVIVELSASLRERQRAALAEVMAAGAVRVEWADQLPECIEGVVIGNEVLDAMPVKLLARQAGVWRERGVRVEVGAGVGMGADPAAATAPITLAWEDRPTEARPPVEPEGAHDYLTEIHPQALAFVRTLADRLVRGVALFIDYGFPEHEYYHPQRSQGTLMCHHQHRADGDPLVEVGEKDITAHVDFTGLALAAQDAGLAVAGYTSQARFLINCGIGARLDAVDLPQRAMAQRLIHEHEMGELFKVLALARGTPAHWVPVGFAHGDRTHRL
ncbi:MAG: SAM-dependent methyltransferase [Comamonas sp.]